MGFEAEVGLITNPKARRIEKGWVAKIDLQNETLEFLRASEVTQPSKTGCIIKAKYEFSNGNYYIILRDDSSHKNKRVYYELYYAFDNKLQELASITFTTKYPEFSAKSDELKQVLKKAYNNANNCKSKTISALIAVAKYHWQKQNNQLDISEIVKQELQNLMQKYNISKQKLLEIVQTL